MAGSLWRAFPCSKRQLRLDLVLQCGQSFRWRESGSGEWLGVVCGRVWRLKQDDTHVYFQELSKEAVTSEIKPVTPKDSHTLKPKRRKNQTTETTRNCGDEAHSLDRKPAVQTISSNIDSKSSIQSVSNNKDSKSTIQSVSNNTSITPSIQSASTKKASTLTEIKQEVPSYDNNWQPEIFKIPTSEDMCELKPKNPDTKDDSLSILLDYFQLHVDVDALYQQWSRSDPHFKKIAADFWGIRILRQDPVENLFAFICSSNNHIARISSMVEKLCVHYGRPITDVDGKMYYSFPTVAALAEPGVEEKLRELGFGYRAKFIATSAKYIMENHGEEWVCSLRHCSYPEAKTQLMKLCGVGAKVADCVCLMSLDKSGAIPVDTHVWQFAGRHYLPALLSAKSVTDKLYQQIGDHFRAVWGEYAGWAHSVMFTAELRHMQSVKASTNKIDKKRPSPMKKKDDVKAPTKTKRVKTSRKK